MSPGKLNFSFTPRLEKVKAGLGAAGVAAVGTEAVASGLRAPLIGGLLGDLLQLLFIVAAGLLAGHVTRPSMKEMKLQIAARKESAIGDAPDD